MLTRAQKEELIKSSNDKSVYKFCLLRDRELFLSTGIIWIGVRDRGWSYHQSQCPDSRRDC